MGNLTTRPGLVIFGRKLSTGNQEKFSEKIDKNQRGDDGM